MPETSAAPTDGAAATPGNLPLRTVLTAGLAMGIAGDVLLRGSGGPGLNILLLYAGLAIAIGAASRRAGTVLGAEARVSIAVGVLLGASLVFRAAEGLQFLAFVGAAAAFAFPALRAGASWIRRSGVGNIVESVVGAAAHAALGSTRLAIQGFSNGSARTEPDRTSRAPAVLRGLLLAAPFLIVFGALFMSADRVFAGLVNDLVGSRLDDMASHLIMTGILTWLACGYLTGFLTGTELRDMAPGPLPRPAVRILEVGIALALIDLLFAAFVAVQFRYLFGGSGIVEVTPGLTYSEYAREGFAQLAFASALVLPSLLAADWVLDRRGPRDDRVFRFLGGLQILLLLVIIASALQRVRVYLAAYGFTESRFYGAAFLGWLTLLSLWFLVTVLRSRRDRFAGVALLSGYVLVAVLLAVNPDVRIARTNLGRADSSSLVPPRPGDTPDASARPDARPVDVRYLASLSGDAVPTLLGALPTLPPEARCVLSDRLLRRWGPERELDWRSWNAPRWRAKQQVSERAQELRSIVASGGCVESE